MAGIIEMQAILGPETGDLILGFTVEIPDIIVVFTGQLQGVGHVSVKESGFYPGAAGANSEGRDEEVALTPDLLKQLIEVSGIGFEGGAGLGSVITNTGEIVATEQDDDFAGGDGRDSLGSQKHFAGAMAADAAIEEFQVRMEGG